MQVLKIPEAAEYLRVHEMTLYRLAKQGKIPAFRVGTGWRFSRQALEQFMEEGCAKN